MGQRDTESENKIALFDSVTGWAFGPTFDTAEEVESFLTFVEKETGDSDLRGLPPKETLAIHSAWLISLEDDNPFTQQELHLLKEYLSGDRTDRAADEVKAMREQQMESGPE